MPQSKINNAPLTNRILSTLPRKEYERLLPSLEEIPLVFEKVLYEPGEVILDVYFPTSGIVSLLAAVEDRATLDSRPPAPTVPRRNVTPELIGHAERRSGERRG